MSGSSVDTLPKSVLALTGSGADTLPRSYKYGRSMSLQHPDNKPKIYTRSLSAQTTGITAPKSYELTHTDTPPKTYRHYLTDFPDTVYKSCDHTETKSKLYDQTETKSKLYDQTETKAKLCDHTETKSKIYDHMDTFRSSCDHSHMGHTETVSLHSLPQLPQYHPMPTISGRTSMKWYKV